MATNPMIAFIHSLRRAEMQRAAAERSDAQLLEDYLNRREESAIEALVRRHGPMVWDVCRRILRDAHDAEDAFQATFLVFVRKAASIRPREMVGNWLYGVAQQTALKARSTAAKRRWRERQLTDLPEATVHGQDPWRDQQPLLDRELGRLPDKYRAAIVLCDLEGKTRKEAARQLGLPEGTVASRLARARTMLAKRLARHGLALSGGTLAAILSAKTASACVPAPLESTTIKAVTLLAVGQAAATGLIPAKVVALVEGVLKAMLMTKLKTALAICFATGLLLLGSAYGYRTLAADKTPAAPPEERTPAAGKAPAALCDDKLRDTLLVLDKKLWEAESNYDVDTMAKLLADDHIHFNQSGPPWTKQLALDHWRRGRFTEFSFPTGRKVVRLNEHTAILTYEVLWRFENKESGNKSPLNHDFLIHCWVQRDGGWFCRYTESINRYNFPDRRVHAEKQPRNESILLVPWPNGKIAVETKDKGKP